MPSKSVVTAETVARETPEERRRRASALARRLRNTYEPRCGLIHANPYQLLVATILSAQCSDEQVNKVTPSLFERWPTPAELAAAGQDELEVAINTLGLFRNKAKSLRATAARLVTEHGGEVPRTMEALTELPGIARKTANVILGTAFQQAHGVVVDTHVKRVSYRLGLTEQTDPVKIERELMDTFAKARWIEVGHTMVWHGRKVCEARKPRCSVCPVADLCPRLGVEVSA